jgi:hypothetical protein
MTFGASAEHGLIICVPHTRRHQVTVTSPGTVSRVSRATNSTGSPALPRPRAPPGRRTAGSRQAREEPGQPGAAHSDDPAQIAAARVQKALARVLLQQHYSRRIACVTPMGIPGEALLNEVSDISLLVLGAAGISAARAPGRTGRYCLRRGTGPLVFVPARPAP